MGGCIISPLKIMIKIILSLLLSITLQSKEQTVPTPLLYTFTVKTIDAKETTLAAYQGKVLLIVNVASKCGFTPQYEGLQKLYNKYQKKGFVILGFPCNQFMQQEPGNEKEIQHFCQVNFGVTFPMFAKIDVNGENTHPLYRYLKSKAPGFLGTEMIKWNFTKFLIDREGKVIKRYGSSTTPKEIEEDIKKVL